MTLKQCSSVLVFVFIYIGFVGVGFSTDLNDSRVMVFSNDTKALIAEMEKAGYDVAGRNAQRNYVEVIISPQQLRDLKNAGYSCKIIETFTGKTSRAIPAGYRDFDAMEPLYLQAQSDYPTLCKVIDMGQTYGAGNTVDGRKIYLVKISDNVTDDEDEPAVLLTFNRHAREIMTAEFAIWVIEKLTSEYGTDPDITNWVNNYQIFIAPCLNPDGFQYCFDFDQWWRKNRSYNSGYYGVDLNRNYDFHWNGPYGGSSNPNSIIYRGPSPNSEQETKAEVGFGLSRVNIVKMMDFHSSGRELLYTYPNSSEFPTLLEAFHKQTAIDISYAFNYGGDFRKPSAEGESYEWELCNTCSFAFLVETGTSFQPSYTTCKNEFKNYIWPGVSYFLDLPIPLRGYVNEVGTGNPIDADIAIQGVNYTEGEIRQTEPKFGAYYYFLPPGNYDITFSAPGYAPKTVQTQIIKDKTTLLNVQLGQGPALNVNGQTCLGGNLDLEFDWPAGANHDYFNGVSLIDSGYTFKNGIRIPIGIDTLFLTTLGVFPGWSGQLDGAGNATASLPIPNLAAVAGLEFYIGYFTADPVKHKPSGASIAVKAFIDF